MRQFRFSVGTPSKPTRFMVDEANDGVNKFVRCSSKERLIALLTRLKIDTPLLPGKENTCVVVSQTQCMAIVCRALEDAFNAEVGEPDRTSHMTPADGYGVGL